MPQIVLITLKIISYIEVDYNDNKMNDIGHNYSKNDNVDLKDSKLTI